MKPANERTEQVLKYLGLAVRAGRVIVGVPLICTALSRSAKHNAPLLVIEASDTSEGTHKRITDKTTYYQLPVLRIAANRQRLALAVGKREGEVAAVAVCEAGLAGAIQAAWQTENDQ